MEKHSRYLPSPSKTLRGNMIDSATTSPFHPSSVPICVRDGCTIAPRISDATAANEQDSSPSHRPHSGLYCSSFPPSLPPSPRLLVFLYRDKYRGNRILDTFAGLSLLTIMRVEKKVGFLLLVRLSVCVLSLLWCVCIILPFSPLFLCPSVRLSVCVFLLIVL